MTLKQFSHHQRRRRRFNEQVEIFFWGEDKDVGSGFSTFGLSYGTARQKMSLNLARRLLHPHNLKPDRENMRLRGKAKRQELARLAAGLSQTPAPRPIPSTAWDWKEDGGDPNAVAEMWVRKPPSRSVPAKKTAGKK